MSDDNEIEEIKKFTPSLIIQSPSTQHDNEQQLNVFAKNVGSIYYSIT